MIEYVRFGGGILIMLCALLFGKGYSNFADRRIAEYEGFLALISHIETEISRSLSYGKELWSGFSNAELERCGMLQHLREGKTPYDAFLLCEEALSLSDKTKVALKKFFSRFGYEYKDSELRRISEVKGDLVVELKSVREELEKNKRVVNALLVGGSLSVVILLI